MRRFTLVRDNVVVAEGIRFSEGPVAVKWLTELWNIVLFSDIKHVEETDTSIVWLDNENGSLNISKDYNEDKKYYQDTFPF